jgi:uncharacterized sporulation protein YeaH/YhbH (DUF444 family)
MSTPANGRVDISGRAEAQFATFYGESRGRSRGRHEASGSDAIRHQLQRNPLADYFFGELNVDALQEALRYSVFRASEGRVVIGRQSEEELRIVMRAVYLQHARHMAADIPGQVRELNARVLKYTVPTVHSAVAMYQRYVRDVSQLPSPMERGVHTSKAGSDTLVMMRPDV